MIQSVFNHDILALIKNAYPEEFASKRLMDWQWGKHGLWHDGNAIRAAVHEMVYKEGIRKVSDIPTHEWKKRLIKYKIYNILAYFNWSIYSLFDYVYPNKFHPTDFKYKTKWTTPNSLQNAYTYMHKIFVKEKLTTDEIYLLTPAKFSRLGLTPMLIKTFKASVLNAKEYYLYRSLGNEENQNNIIEKSNTLVKERFDKNLLLKLKKVAQGNLIYNLRSNFTLYNFIKRHAKNNNKTINDFILDYGFIYKSSKESPQAIDKDELWKLRRNGLSFVEIAHILNCSAQTITKFCNTHFGGDPLIPRPICDYTTVQTLMDEYHVDHKTILKIVKDNGFENHTTLRFRYLKKYEIEPALKLYIENNKAHLAMAKRYSNLN